MLTEMKLADPENVEVRIAVTMTLGEWRKVYNRLSEGEYVYPVVELAKAISAAISDMTHRYAKGDGEGEVEV